MHLDCYVEEPAGKHNLRDDDTIIQIASVVVGTVGKRLMCRDLFADNAFDSGARAK